MYKVCVPFSGEYLHQLLADNANQRKVDQKHNFKFDQ